MTETPRQQRITLCGSTRFKKAWMEWNARLTLQGHVVYSVAMWSHNVRVEPTEEQKKLLDQVHIAKIDNSDAVFVLDVGGYIGESTKREIAHAEATGKPVHYLSQTYPDWTEDDCLWAQEGYVIKADVDPEAVAKALEQPPEYHEVVMPPGNEGKSRSGRRVVVPSFQCGSCGQDVPPPAVEAPALYEFDKALRGDMHDHGTCDEDGQPNQDTGQLTLEDATIRWPQQAARAMLDLRSELINRLCTALQICGGPSVSELLDLVEQRLKTEKGE